MVWTIVIAVVVVLVVVVGGFLAWLIIADKMKEKNVREHGRPVLASLVMANHTLSDPDGDPETAGVVVFSLEQPSSDLRAALAQAAKRVYRLYIADDVDSLPPAEQDVAAVIKNHNYTEARRNRLPSELSSGREIYLADLWIQRERLPENWAADRALACMVTGDDEGQIIMLPPDEAASQQIYSAALLDESNEKG